MRFLLALFLTAAGSAAAQTASAPAFHKVREIPAVGFVSHDGTLLASASETSLGVWRLSDGRQVHRIQLPRVSKVNDQDVFSFYATDLSPDDRYLLLTLDHHRDWKTSEVIVYVANLEKESLRPIYTMHRTCFHFPANPGGIAPYICPQATSSYSPDGKRILVSILNYLQQTAGFSGPRRIQHEALVMDAAGKVQEDVTEFTTEEWAPSTKPYTPTELIKTTVEAPIGAGTAGFSADGRLLGVIKDDSGCEVRDLTAGTRLSFLDDCTSKDDLRFGAPGALRSNTSAYCAKDCAYKLWDADTGKVRKFTLAESNGVGIAPAGDYAVTVKTLPATNEGAKGYVAHGAVELRAAPFDAVLSSMTYDAPAYDEWSLTLGGSLALRQVFSGDSRLTEVYETGIRGGSPAAASAPAAPPLDVDAVPNAKLTPNPDAYAIVIGVEKYRQDGIPSVDYAVHDAQTVNSYLVGAMGFDPKNVVLLTNSQATRTDFEKNLKWLSNRVTADSRVFVYFAGHGSPDPSSGQGFLMPYEADPSYLDETAFPIADLYAALGKLPAKDVTVVLDACFSGEGGRSLIAKGTRPLVSVVQTKAGPNTVVLAAAGANQVSASYPEAHHGLLTYYLLAGLHGEADAKHDGLITTAELYAYVRPAVERAAKLQNVEQTPNLMSPPDAPARPWIELAAPKK